MPAGIQVPRRAATYFGGAAPERLPVASADDQLVVSWVISMLKPRAARIKSTIAALPIHMMRISPFSFSSSGRFSLSPFLRVRLDPSEDKKHAVQKHSAGFHIYRASA
jgi:hypothetical protein